MALNNRGESYFNLGNYNKAIANYDQALAIKDDYYEAFYNKGLSLFRLNKYENAIECYNKCLKIKSDHYKAIISLGLVYHKLNRYIEAIAKYDEAEEIQIKNNLAEYAELLYNRACSKAMIGHISDSLTDLKKAIKIGGDRIKKIAKEQEETCFNNLKDSKEFRDILKK